MAHLIEAAGQRLGGHACHEDGPQRHLRAVGGSLLHDRHRVLRTLQFVAHQLVGLVGGVAEEVALKHRLGAQLLAGGLELLGHQAQLVGVGQRAARVGETDHDVVLAHFRAVVEGVELYLREI